MLALCFSFIFVCIYSLNNCVFNFHYLYRNEVFDYSISVWKSLHMILNELSLWFTEADLHIDLSAVLDKPIENIKPDEKSKAIVVLEV